MLKDIKREIMAYPWNLG